MKNKLLTILHGILFYSLVFTGLVWLYNKIMDAWEAMKVNTDLPQEDYKETFKTTLPDDMLPNFNEWAKYINKQLN